MISTRTKSLSKASALLLVLICLISYGQTLLMYFWQDDSALIFKLQHQAERMGSFGAGLWERGPYQYLVVPFAPFFPIFDKEPLGYFAVGLLSYIIASFAFYYLALEIFKDKKLALIASLIFSAGYVGSDTMFRIINSWQTNIGLILTILSFAFYTKYKNINKAKYYFLGLLFFLLSIELVYVRSHSIVLPIIAIEIFYQLKNWNWKKLLIPLLRIMPFAFFFERWYLHDANFGSQGISSFIANIIRGQLEQLIVLSANIGNIFIPSTIQQNAINVLMRFKLGDYEIILLIFSILITCFYLLFRIAKIKNRIFLIMLLLLIIGLLFNFYCYSQGYYWYRNLSDIVSGQLGISLSIVTVFLSFLIYKKNKAISLALFLGWVIAVSQIFGYFTQYPTSIFSTTHRYFSYSLIGFCLWWTGIVLLLKPSKKKTLNVGLVLASGLILVNLVLGVKYQHDIVVNRSIPTRQFYQSLLYYYPTISSGSAFYFDVQSDQNYSKKFGDFFSVGSMPETTALGMYYDLDRYDIWMTTSADEIISRLSQGDQDLNKTYTFFYGDNGLINTTDRFRSAILGNANTTLPITPIKLAFEAKVLLDPPKNYPVRYGKGEKYTIDEVSDITMFLTQYRLFSQTSEISSDSEWSGREIESINDLDTNTSWQGHRIYWGDNQKETISIDLKNEKMINKFAWQTWRESLSPISYQIFVSNDGSTWQLVYQTDEQQKRDGQWTDVSFDPVVARFIKMQISKTLSGDSPAISEIFVGNLDKSVNPEEALYFEQDPSFVISNTIEWENLLATIDKFFRINIKWETNKNDQYNEQSSLLAVPDGSWHKYEVIIAAGGTRLESLDFFPSIESKLEVRNIQEKNLSLEELKQSNLIKRFSEN